MGAPKGNKFWQLRSKHGREKIFQDPKVLWESASEYFNWCEANPLKSIEFNGKDAIECEVPKMRAFTYAGLCVYLDCDTETFHKLKADKGFFDVYTRICRIIYTQKFEGAAAGLLNASIIARDLGLSDKQETKQEITGKDGGDIKVTLNLA